MAKITGLSDAKIASNEPEEIWKIKEYILPLPNTFFFIKKERGRYWESITRGLSGTGRRKRVPTARKTEGYILILGTLRKPRRQRQRERFNEQYNGSARAL